MKTKQFMWAMIPLVLGVFLAGCSKDENNENQDVVKSDLVGTWEGTITFTSTQPQSGTARLAITLSNDMLTGFLSVQDDPYTTRIQGISFSNGVWNCSLVCNTPNEDDCKNFNVTGTITKSGQSLNISFAGIFCGKDGGEQATVTGTFTLLNTIPDVGRFFTFAALGREWRYKVTNFDQSECLLEFQITEDKGNGVFAGIATNDCQWMWQQTPFWWYVSPNQWCDMMSPSLDSCIMNLLSNAKAGDHYQTFFGNDTVWVDVLSVSDPVTINGQTYDCYKLYKKTHQFGSYSEGYVWMTFNLGMIKYEAISPNSPSDVFTEELIWRNFQ
jgi:hypothetical protein